MTSSLYAMDAEIRYRQQRLRGAVGRFSRKHRTHERFEVVHPAGDARA